MSRLTVMEAKIVRSSVREIKSLADTINSYRQIEEELGINLESQISELEQMLFEKERGLKYV